MGIQFFIELNRHSHLVIMKYFLFRKVYYAASPLDNDRRHHFVYVISLLVTALLGILCFQLMPILDDEPCILYITKATHTFSYVILYGVQLISGIIAFFLTTTIIHITQRHLRQINDISIPSTTPVKSTICQPICWRYTMHIMWFILPRLVIISTTHAYLSYSDFVDSTTLHFIYVLNYLATSSYAIVYLIISKGFRKAMYDKLVKIRLRSSQ